MYEELDWGENDSISVKMIKQEVFQDNIYERFRKVQGGDVVVDIGANIGAFTYHILSRSCYDMPSKVICVEPSDSMIRTLIENMDGKLVNIVNSAISEKTGFAPVSSEMNIYAHKAQMISTISLQDFMRIYDIRFIDFLKTDCEGGEFDLFTKKNYPLLIDSLDHVAGEFHLPVRKNGYELFLAFRDLYLANCGWYKVFSGYHHDVDEDITDRILDDRFVKDYIERYRASAQLMVYFNMQKKEAFKPL